MEEKKLEKAFPIFLCYRGKKDVLLAKNFSKYIRKIQEDTSDARKIGYAWYSDSEPLGNFKNDIPRLISNCKYFIIFVYPAFAEDFYKDGQLDSSCITAQEFLEVYKALLRKQDIRIITINMQDGENNGEFSEKSKENIQKLFDFSEEDIKNKLFKELSEEEKEAIWKDYQLNKDDYYDAFIKCNLNRHNLRSDDDELLYDKLLNAMCDNKESVRTKNFGFYPQTRVEDDYIIEQLNKLTRKNKRKAYCYYRYGKEDNKFMYYIDIEYDGHKYRGVQINDKRPCLVVGGDESYQKENGYCVIKNSYYWFLYEPIQWNILEEKENYVFLLSQKVLDSQPFSTQVKKETIKNQEIFPNDYVNSHIRKWLTTEFYNLAFNKKEQESIIPTGIICDNRRIEDNIYLLSEEEIIKYTARYELSKDSTDYAKCQGVYIVKKADWLLRSREETNSIDSKFVSGEDSKIRADIVYYTNGGIVPGIKVKKNFH